MKKIICVILATVILLSVCACASENETVETLDNSQTVSTNESSEEKFDPDRIAAIDCSSITDGGEINFLVQTPVSAGVVMNEIKSDSEYNSDTINQVLTEREIYLKGKYGITLKNEYCAMKEYIDIIEPQSTQALVETCHKVFA